MQFYLRISQQETTFIRIVLPISIAQILDTMSTVFTESVHQTQYSIYKNGPSSTLKVSTAASKISDNEYRIILSNKLGALSFTALAEVFLGGTELTPTGLKEGIEQLEAFANESLRGQGSEGSLFDSEREGCFFMEMTLNPSGDGAETDACFADILFQIMPKEEVAAMKGMEAEWKLEDKEGEAASKATLNTHIRSVSSTLR